MDNIESSDVRTWKKSGESFSNNGSSPIKLIILLRILWMGTKKIALKRSHTEKAKLTRARPRFSFGFSRLAITFSRVTSQSHNLVIDLASFHQVEGGTETSLKLSTVGNFDTTRNQEKKRKRGKEEKRKRGKEEKRKRGKEENGLLSPLGFLFWLDFWLDEIDGF